MLNPVSTEQQTTSTPSMIPTMPASTLLAHPYRPPIGMPLTLNPYSAMLCSWSSAWNSLQEAHQKLAHSGDPQGGQSARGDNSQQGNNH